MHKVGKVKGPYLDPSQSERKWKHTTWNTRNRVSYDKVSGPFLCLY